MTSTQVDPPGALDGIRVVDMTQGLAGPFCAMTMAQHGAQVVKIEPPAGDWSRTIGAGAQPQPGATTAAFLTCNRGKRGVVLDLKSPAGHAVAMRLLCGADVVMESNRAGVAKRLGVDYEAVRSRNPEVIYLSITGFGQAGPYSDRPVTDAIMQAFSGLMTRNLDNDGLPRRVEFPIPDYTTGMNAYQTVVTALLGRARGGGGAHLDVSLMQSLLFYQQQGIAQDAAEAPRQGTPFPPTGTYATADGILNVSVVRELQFQSLCTTLGLETLGADPRFATLAARLIHAQALLDLLRPAFLDRLSAELLEALQAADVPCARVNGYRDAVTDPHVAAIGLVSWIEEPTLGRVPLVNVAGARPLAPDDPRARAPALGADTRAVLAELGYAAAEVEAMLGDGAARAATRPEAG